MQGKAAYDIDPHNGFLPRIEPQIELKISVGLNFMTCYRHIDDLKIQEYMWKMDYEANVSKVQSFIR